MTVLPCMHPSIHPPTLPSSHLLMIIYMQILIWTCIQASTVSIYILVQPHPSIQHANRWSWQNNSVKKIQLYPPRQKASFKFCTPGGVQLVVLHCTLHRRPKLLEPAEKYLFDLSPQEIHTKMDILRSGLEYHDELKAVIERINPLCNPILFAVTRELCAPLPQLRCIHQSV